MPNIIRQKRKANYTVIPNEMLNNTELSFKAKAILCYLLSKPDKWSVYLSQLAKASTDGYESVVSGMNELIAKKYVFRQPNSGVNPGGWEYFVYDEPQVQEDSRLSEKPTRDFADSGKPLTNKDRLSKVKKDIKENLLTSYEEEEESSAMASHSSEVVTQPNLFPTNPSEANASGSANAKLNSADGNGTTPPIPLAPPRTRKSREPKPVDEKFIAELQRLNPDKDVQREAKDAQTWVLSRPDRKYTRGFLAAWVIRSKNIINPDKFHNNNSF